MKKFRPDVDVAEWGGRYYPYDIVKEGAIALVVVLVLVLGLSVLFGSPDDPQVTVQSWSKADPVDFATTAFGELAGTTTSATYGPPYNHNGDGQHMGPIYLQKWAGVRIPVDSANDFVLYPLSTLAGNHGVSTALSTWNAATVSEQNTWITSYGNGTIGWTCASGAPVCTVTNTATGTGPLPTLINALTAMARKGALDAQLMQGNAFYSTNYTKPLLFVADGGYLATLAGHQNLGGDQWGMMNETGAYPGQAWLWLYTTLYQIPPYNSTWSANADVYVWATMMILTVLLMLVPFIPGLRSIPRWTKVYRLIWREHYRNLK